MTSEAKVRSIKWDAQVAAEIPNGQYNDLTEKRIGVMLHFDGSSTDAGSLAWFKDPECKVSYNFLVLDNGDFGTVAPINRRAWHAGICRPSSDKLVYADANSAFYGISAATNEKVEVTAVQMLTIAMLTKMLFDKHNWPVTDTWRIVGHDTEAWPRGRKSDPTGPNKLNPILAIENIKQLIQYM